MIDVPPGTPVVTLATPALVDAIISAAAHAVTGVRIDVVTRSAAAGGLSPPDQDTEVAVVVGLTAVDERDVLRAVVEGGGRAIPVLGLSTNDAGRPSVTARSLDLLGDASVRDLHVAVPAFEDDETRARVWDRLRDRRVEARHQLAEVSAGAWGSLPPVGTDPWAATGAIAAGILAGRIAAGNRRWRAQLQR